MSVSGLKLEIGRVSCQLLQRLLRVQAVDHALVRVLLSEFAKVEGAGLRDINAGAQRVRVGAETPDHLLW